MRSMAHFHKWQLIILELEVFIKKNEIAVKKVSLPLGKVGGKDI